MEDLLYHRGYAEHTNFIHQKVNNCIMYNLGYRDAIMVQIWDVTIKKQLYMWSTKPEEILYRSGLCNKVVIKYALVILKLKLLCSLCREVVFVENVHQYLTLFHFRFPFPLFPIALSGCLTSCTWQVDGVNMLTWTLVSLTNKHRLLDDGSC